ADFNGDGYLDIAASQAGILLGKGDGTFGPLGAVSMGARKIFLVAGDFNGDGRLDVVDGNIDLDTVTVYLQVPRAGVSPHSLTFSPQTVGTTSKPKKVTLTNTGSALLQITGISTSGDFAQTHTCTSTLEAGAACTIEVTFHPTTTGTLTGSLTIVDDASGSPQSVTRTGTGQ